MNGYRWLQLAGAVISMIMVILMFVGTYNKVAFYSWGAVAIVGLGAFALGRKLDERQRQQRLTEEFKQRHP